MNASSVESLGNQQESISNSTELDHSEVYFLVLHWLSKGPCKQAAAALLQEVAQHGLLPHHYDVQGGSRPHSYQSLLQQHSRLPGDGLLQLLQQCLGSIQARQQLAGAQGFQSLLAAGSYAALPAFATPQQPPYPSWLRSPANIATLPQLQLLQQTGITTNRCSSNSSRLPLQYVAEQYCHHATFRGHGFPVFSLIYDKKGKRVVTGADDAIIKIWSLETGLLLVTGRGHTGEISDLSLSADGNMVASGSTDSDIRIWSMMPHNLGLNTAVLRGHTAPVTLIDFHPSIPSALLSASMDGSARIWDASDQHFAPLLLLPAASVGAFSSISSSTLRLGVGAAAATRSLAGVVGAVPAAAAAAAAVPAAADELEEDPKGVMCCEWSPDGSFIVVGSQDCGAYLWHWNWQQQGALQQQSSAAAAAACLAFETATAAEAQQGAADAPQQQQCCFSSSDWPVPVELQKLMGHKNEVIQTAFSRSGSMLATGSLDGAVRVWRLVHGSKGRSKLCWQEALPPLMVVAVETAAAAAVRARQRREQVQALTINRVAWSADDRKILAAASDNIIRVWCAHTGQLLQLLKGHNQQTHVLEMHPFDARIAMSAGYDGHAILWNIDTGEVLKRFSSSDTIPLARGSWAPPVIQLVDGQFSPDGNSFCVSDVAGQFSVYSIGAPTPLLLSAPYDQFFKKDYDPIMHDEAGFVAYVEPAGVPTWHLKGQQLLCDNQFMPYPEEFQEAYKEGRVLEFVKSGGGGVMTLRGSSMVLPTSLQLWPPTVTAAVWKALEDRAALMARGSSRIVSETTARDTAERHALEEHSKLLSALMRGMTLQEAEQQAQCITQAAAQRQQQHQQRQIAAAAASASVGAAARSGSSGQQQQQQQQQDDAELLAELVNEMEEQIDVAGSDSDYAADQVLSGSDTDWGDVDDVSEEYDSDFSAGRHGQRVSERQRIRRQQRGASDGVGRRTRTRSGRTGPVTRRSAAGTPQRRRQQQQQQRSVSTRQQQRKRHHSNSSDDEDGDSHDAAAAVNNQDASNARSQKRRSSRRAAAAGVAAAAAAAAADDDDNEWETGSEEQEEQHQEHVQISPPPKRRRRQATAAADEPAAAAAAAAAAAPAGSSKRARSFGAYSWLCNCTHSPNAYVPQLGDDVVYLYQGHKKLLDAKNDRLTERPWETLKRPGAGQQQWMWQQQYWQQQQQQQWQQQQLVWWQQQQQQQMQAITAAQLASDGDQAAAVAAAAGGFGADVPPATISTLAAAAAAAVPEAAAAPVSSDQQQQQQQQGPVQQASFENAIHTPTVAATDVAAATDAATAAAAAAVEPSTGMPAPEPYVMRPAEPCTVVGLDYIIQDEQTVALLTLQLTGAAPPAAAAIAAAAIDSSQQAESSAVAAASAVDAQRQADAAPAAAVVAAAAATPGAGYLFQVVLPHPFGGHADFVILQSRFIDSVNKQWQIGDKVQNHLLDEGDDSGGGWWFGTIAEDARITNPYDEVTADPYGCGGLWERYKVIWDNVQPADAAAAAADHAPAAAAAGGGDDGGAGGNPAAAAWLSPWELYESGLTTEAVLEKEHVTQMTTEQVARLLHAVDRLMHGSKYRAFATAPAPDAVYATDDGDQIYNKVIALPMGLRNIQERLEAGYYRSLQALLHDASLIATNAATFNGQDSPLAARALELYRKIEAASDPQAATAAAAAAAAGIDGSRQQTRKKVPANIPVTQVNGALGTEDPVPAAAAAVIRGEQQQQQRRRRTAAAKADDFLAGFFADAISESDSEAAAAAATDKDPEADAALAAAAAANGGVRRSGHGVRHEKLRRSKQQKNRMRYSSGSSDEDAAAEDSDLDKAVQRPTRRSSRQQQQQRRQQRQRYHDDYYASDFDSGDSDGDDNEQQQQQQLRRSSRRQQQQQGGLELSGLEQQTCAQQQQQQQWRAQCSQAQAVSAAAAAGASMDALAPNHALGSPAAAAAAAAAAAEVDCVNSGAAAATTPQTNSQGKRIRMKMQKTQQQQVTAAFHCGSAPFDAAAAAAAAAVASNGCADWMTAAAAIGDSALHGSDAQSYNYYYYQQQLQQQQHQEFQHATDSSVPAWTNCLDPTIQQQQWQLWQQQQQGSAFAYSDPPDIAAAAAVAEHAATDAVEPVATDAAASAGGGGGGSGNAEGRSTRLRMRMKKQS